DRRERGFVIHGQLLLVDDPGHGAPHRRIGRRSAAYGWAGAGNASRPIVIATGAGVTDRGS
ncbi:MAG: GTPase Era, partial [Planctomycetota bacterium]